MSETISVMEPQCEVASIRPEIDPVTVRVLDSGWLSLDVKLVHLDGWLGHREDDFPNAEAAADSMVSLPLYPQLTDGEVERVIAAVNRALAEVASG